MKVYITILEHLVDVSGLTVGKSLSLTGVGTSIIDCPIAGCSSFQAGVATLVRNDYFFETQTEIYKAKRFDKYNYNTI